MVSETEKTCEVTSGDTKYSGDVEIPDKVAYNGETLTVTSIGESAFRVCSSLTNVIMPNLVTSIGNYAFVGCTGLTSISIPNSVMNIGNDVFNGCTALEKFIIEDGDKTLNCGALSCSLKYLYLGRNLSYNGYSPFNYTLTEVNIGNHVTTIGDYMFCGCTNITNVTIPNSVTSIGNNAFSGCTGLTSVTIPNSVTNIGNYAFSGCI